MIITLRLSLPGILLSSFLAAALWYILILQRRKHQFRRIAGMLGASCRAEGFFSPGFIEGRRKNRKLMASTRREYTGKIVSLFTDLSLSCSNRGIPLIIEAPFFTDFPDWNHIFTVGTRREKTCLADIMVPRAPVEIPPHYRKGISRALYPLSQIFTPADKLIGRGRISITTESVAFHHRGMLMNRIRVSRIFLFLECLADLIEDSPVR